MQRRFLASKCFWNSSAFSCRKESSLRLFDADHDTQTVPVFVFFFAAFSRQNDLSLTRYTNRENRFNVRVTSGMFLCCTRYINLFRSFSRALTTEEDEDVLVTRVLAVGIVVEARLPVHDGVAPGATDGERVTHHGPLRFPVERHHLPCARSTGHPFDLHRGEM